VKWGKRGTRREGARPKGREGRKQEEQCIFETKMVSFLLFYFSWISCGFGGVRSQKKIAGTNYVEKVYVGKYQVSTGPPINEPSLYPYEI